jgi:uncharacterized paraquat-inducible protein A
MPKVACPNCSAKLDAPLEYEGRNAKCVKCGKSFVIAFQAAPKSIAAKVAAVPVRVGPPPLPVPVPAEEPEFGDPIEDEFGAFGEIDDLPPAPSSFRPKLAAKPEPEKPKANRRVQPCRDCGEIISRRADSCPRCGASQARSSDPFVLFALAVAVMLNLFMSPILAPLVLALAAGAWLVGLARMVDQRRLMGIVLSVITLGALILFAGQQIERERKDAATEHRLDVFRGLKP